MDQNKIVENIRGNYQEKKRTKLDELMELDRKVKRPAETFAYTFGTIGSLVLGAGMSFAMGVIPGGMALGVAIGVVGLAMVGANYFLYNGILRSRKEKYGEQVLALSDEILQA